MTPGLLLSKPETGSGTPHLDTTSDYEAISQRIAAPVTQMPELGEGGNTERSERATSSNRPGTGGIRFSGATKGTSTGMAITFGTSSRPAVAASARPTNRFTSALAALKPLALEEIDAADEIAWAEAAQRLRRVAVTGRSQAPRHAAIALVVSDALTFTPKVARAPASRSGLVAALRSLQEPFVSADMERTVVQELLRGGWKLTAPFDAGAFAEFARSLPK